MSTSEQEESQKPETNESPLGALSATEAARDTFATVYVGDIANDTSTLDLADRMLSSLSEIGRRLQYSRRASNQEFPSSPTFHAPFVHIYSGGASLPAREALYPLTASAERNLLVENILVAQAASDTGALIPVSLADALFSTPAREDHSVIDEGGCIIYPCEDFSQWCNAVTELRAELTADSLRFAIEPFSLDRLTVRKSINIGVLVEGIDDAEAVELRDKFCESIGEKYGTPFHVIAYEDLSEVRELVNALTDRALDVVASLSNR